MLKNLFDLVVPKITAVDPLEANSQTTQKQVKSMRQTVLEIRNEIDPIDLEQELHLHLTKAYVELDHIVDILAVCALKTKDECEQEIFSESKRASVIPEFLFNEEFRTFNLYWRRVEKVIGKTTKTAGGIQSRRIPITRRGTNEDEAGIYPKTIFAGMSADRKAQLKETEDQFRKLRVLVQCVTQMRRLISVFDRHSTAFFDNAIVYETKERITTSKPHKMPEERTEIVQTRNP